MFKNLNLGALGLEVSFLESLELAKIGGFQGVDIDISEMEKLVETRSSSWVKHIVYENGLKLGGWGLPVNFREDDEKYQKDLERLPKFAQIARDIGCQRVYTWLIPFSDEIPYEENFKRHVERLKSIAKILGDHQCRLGLEFVAPKTLRVNHKYEFIHDLDGVLRLCEAINERNVGLLLDSWHWYTSHGTVDQLRSLTAEQVIYVHINDAPAGTPIDEQIDNIRRLPGETGVIDLTSFLQTLKDIGYDGPVTPEPFEKKLREMPTLEAVKITGEALARVWRAVGLKE